MNQSAIIHYGAEVLETNDAGFIWIKLCKSFFNHLDDICICFTYIPPQESVYFKMHDTIFFFFFFFFF